MPAPISDLLPLDRLTPYLEANLPGFDGLIEAKKFEGGQSNPTFLLVTPGKSYVLRRKPSGMLLKSAHAVDREYRVQRALIGSDVPVADMLLLCEDDTVIGAAFYVMEHVEGRIFFDPRLPDQTNDERRAMVDEMNRVLAALHSVDVDAVGLSDYGPPGNYFERQVGRWSKQYRASETDSIADMDNLIDALNARMPEDDGQRTLVHGDYRIDNMIFAPDSADCLAVLDWELSTIGHPYADLAAVIMQWQMPTGSEGRGLAGVDRAALGLPGDGQFIKSYCERRGIAAIPDFGFYLAFNFFRMGAILQGVKKRALDGNASDPERGLRMGAYVAAFAGGGLKALNHG
ncbi:phosphotransferase family protein [Actibacterium sp. 188UL27-1]|uniref:phosphotransferase family protein n=1 Tax=Actibacterium sp. 188UL27-1 TaxID=2786961 RepID=UPI00195B36E7|nr:phosphotransferase family protein [Actibacterium sp. 188UL27-1]MBM7069639.1 phosphotransferase family protein [Actibacterium sp. 188UL27-1]